MRADAGATQRPAGYARAGLAASGQRPTRARRLAETVQAATVGQAGVLVSAISIWEIGMLVAKGRLTLDRDVRKWVQLALPLPGVSLIGLDPEIAMTASGLHGAMQGDPADRLIVARARHLGAVVLTGDRLILEYCAACHVRALRAGA